MLFRSNRSDECELEKSVITTIPRRFSRDSWSIGILKRHLSWDRSQSTEAQQLVGSADEVGVQLDASDAAKASATKPAPALHPTKDIFNASALSLTDPVTGVPSGAPIRPRCASALDLRQVRPMSVSINHCTSFN